MQIDGDAQLALRAEQRRDERGEDLRRVVPAGDAVFVVANPHQARILERLDGAERDVGVGTGARRIVDQIVGDEARRRRRQPPLVAQVEQRAVDEIDGADVDDFRVGLDVGDQQLDGVQVAGDGLADARREVRREQARVLGAGRVDDQVGAPDALDHPGVDRRARRVAGEQGPQPVGVEAGERRIAGVEPPIDEEDLADLVALPGADDLRLARQQRAVGVDRDEVGVGAVGDVLEVAGRHAEQRAVVVDGVVEPAAGAQEAAGEHEIADGAVGEVERHAGAPHLGEEGVEPLGDGVDGGRRTVADEPSHLDGWLLAVGRFAAQRRQCRGGGGGVAADRQPMIDQRDQRRRGVQLGGDPRGVLAEVGRAQAVAEEAPDLTGRGAIVVAVDDQGDVDAIGADQLLREGSRAATAGEQHHLQTRPRGRRRTGRDWRRRAQGPGEHRPGEDT